MGHKGTKIKTKICKNLTKINGYFIYPHTEFGSERSLYNIPLPTLFTRREESY